MDADRYKTLTGKAKATAVRGGFPGEADDFAQDAVMKIANGRKATLNQLFVDYLREKLGSGKANRRYNEHLAYVNVSDMDVAGNHDMPGDDIDFFAMLSNLSERQRAVLVLRFKWDMDLHEIGEVFGVSESRISQDVTAVSVVLKKRLLSGKA